MTDLTKIEKPYVFCTKEEQEGLCAIMNIPDALQILSSDGEWRTRHIPRFGLNRSLTYRQNPDWNPPKLDVPDWFWDNTNYNYVTMDQSGEIFAHKSYPDKTKNEWLENGNYFYFRLDGRFTHNFNPHNIPWDQSLTVRPGFEE